MRSFKRLSKCVDKCRVFKVGTNIRGKKIATIELLAHCWPNYIAAMSTIFFHSFFSQLCSKRIAAVLPGTQGLRQRPDVSHHHLADVNSTAILFIATPIYDEFCPPDLKCIRFALLLLALFVRASFSSSALLKGKPVSRCVESGEESCPRP